MKHASIFPSFSELVLDVKVNLCDQSEECHYTCSTFISSVSCSLAWDLHWSGPVLNTASPFSTLADDPVLFVLLMITTPTLRVVLRNPCTFLTNDAVQTEMRY